jgi:hypothetical protein
MYPPSIAAVVHALGLIGAFPTRRTAPEQLASLMRRLHPLACGHSFLRLGGDGDGGYLVPDDLTGIAACLSAGIGRDSRFERDCADRGMQVFLADGSVKAPSVDHPRFCFAPLFIGAVDDDDWMTLDAWTAAHPEVGSGDLLLKLDIEGAEYETILAAPGALLARCRLIVIEFHRLDHLWSEPFFGIVSHAFEKLLRDHACVHIHPNNSDGVLRHRGLDVPPTMEFTFLRRDRLPTEPSWRSDFPHPLDQPNTASPPVLLPRCWRR